MSKIQIPVAVSLPNAAGQPLQIAVTPEGVFGRVDNGQKGRGNRFAMFGIQDKGHSHEGVLVEMPRDFKIVQTGLIEVDEEQLKAVCERGYATGDEATLVNTLRKAWKDEVHFLSNVEESGPWLDNVVKPTWTPIIPVAAPVVAAPIEIPVEELEISAPVVLDATVVMDANSEGLAGKAVAIHDNWAAYTVPTLDFKWEEGNFLNTKISQFEYLDRAMASKSKRKWNLQITGPTGCGKSTLMTAWAASRGIHLAQIPFGEATDTTSLVDDVALVGGFSVRVLTALGMILKYGGAIEIQEPNAASDGMLTTLYPWLDFSRTVTMSNNAQFKVHPDTLIVVTRNPVDAAHTHTSTMSAALNRRFWNVKMGYVDEIEEKLVPPVVLRDIAKEIRQSDIKMPFGTDTLVAVHQAIEDFGLAQAVQGLLDSFEDPADQEVARPIVDVRLDELAAAYGETIESDVADADLDWGIQAPSV